MDLEQWKRKIFKSLWLCHLHELVRLSYERPVIGWHKYTSLILIVVLINPRWRVTPLSPVCIWGRTHFISINGIFFMVEETTTWYNRIGFMIPKIMFKWKIIKTGITSMYKTSDERIYLSCLFY